jgi:hypothetical protein
MMTPDHISERESVILACDLIAIPLEDRSRYRELRLRLADSLNSVKEVQSGYAFEFRSEFLSADEICEWINLERLCCPWISIRRGQILARTIEVHMAFPEQAKDVARGEFSDWL